MKYFIIALSFGLAACQKVINIDLNSAAPQIVIQGNVSNPGSSDTVYLNQTVNFSEPNTFPPVSGAFVTISDNRGNIDTMSSSNPGAYVTSKIVPMPGTAYTLLVEANGKTYTATSTMPSPVAIDTLFLKSTFFLGQTHLQVIVGFKDPGVNLNYYRLLKKVNNTMSKETFTLSNEFKEGQFIVFPFLDNTDTITHGDSVRVYLQSIDKNVYQYFVSLPNASGGGGNGKGPPVSPANPASNINKNALGYFSAFSVTSKKIVVP